MAKLYLVRHGKATAGWGMQKDPGLDDLGRAQAKAAALDISPVGAATDYHQPSYQNEGDFQAIGGNLGN
jgi:broad specificity phosphatase PhoE